MKHAVIGFALLVGTIGAGYCQSRTSDQPDRPIHPGTALLDSMGIVAGAPDATPMNKVQSDTAATVTLAQPAKAPPRPQ
jgi:hypothetical protein